MSVPTLFHLASKTLAACNHYTDLSRNIMPNEVTEQLVLHFTEKKLLTFVESMLNILHIVIFVSNLWDLKEILENLILPIISLSQNLVIEQYLK